MNRRNFISNILVAGASFTVLPGAGRLWRAQRPYCLKYRCNMSVGEMLVRCENRILFPRREFNLVDLLEANAQLVRARRERGDLGQLTFVVRES